MTCPLLGYILHNLLPFSQSSLSLKKGMRHGGPLSLLLFNMAMESLAHYVHDKGPSGMSSQTQELRLAMFADDIQLFSSNPEKNLPNFKQILTCFSSSQAYALFIRKARYYPYLQKDLDIDAKPHLFHCHI